MLRNVYDFDNTIYAGDSTFDFCRYCLRRYPRTALSMAAALPWFVGMQLGLCSKTRAKERLYRFLRHVPDVEWAVSGFWETHFQNVKSWYLAQMRTDDLIISASPTFLVAPACRKLGVELLASPVDAHTGKTEGLNCHGEEKVRRMREAAPDCRVNRFYSDALSDAPLARIARESFLVRGERRQPWPHGKKKR